MLDDSPITTRAARRRKLAEHRRDPLRVRRALNRCGKCGPAPAVDAIRDYDGDTKVEDRRTFAEKFLAVPGSSCAVLIDTPRLSGTFAFLDGRGRRVRTERGRLTLDPACIAGIVLQWAIDLEGRGAGAYAAACAQLERLAVVNHPSKEELESAGWRPLEREAERAAARFTRCAARELGLDLAQLAPPRIRVFQCWLHEAIEALTDGGRPICVVWADFCGLRRKLQYPRDVLKDIVDRAAGAGAASFMFTFCLRDKDRPGISEIARQQVNDEEIGTLGLPFGLVVTNSGKYSGEQASHMQHIRLERPDVESSSPDASPIEFE